MLMLGKVGIQRSMEYAAFFFNSQSLLTYPNNPKTSLIF